MVRYVIDTNVAIVANGDDASIKRECRISAIEMLLQATKHGMIFLDDRGEIQNEYRTYLDPRGQPGVGDRFYLEIINSDPRTVTRVHVPKDADGEFIDVPQEIIDANFDPSDRKFVAVAVQADACIYNAVDSDWVEARAVIEASGVQIVFLCGGDPTQWRQPD